MITFQEEKKMRRMVLFLPLILLLSGCPRVERDAYNIVVAAKAFIGSLQSQHPECSTAQTTICVDLRKAAGAKDLLIDAGEAYCQESSFGVTDVTACVPAPKGTAAYTQALNALNSALSGYNQAEKDLKAVIQ
jgi:hypothetical protein